MSLGKSWKTSLFFVFGCSVLYYGLFAAPVSRVLGETSETFGGVSGRAPLKFANSTDTLGDFTLRAEPFPILSNYEPQSIPFVFENRSNEPVVAEVTFYSTDTLRPLAADKTPTKRVKRQVMVAAGTEETLHFEFGAFPGTYNAHYPLHALAEFSVGGEKKRLHAIRVIETLLPPPSAAPQTTPVRLGGVSLLGKDYRAAFNYLGKKREVLGTNFTGSDSTSHTFVAMGGVDCGGDFRTALSLHPPYTPQTGSLWLDYPVTLPQRVAPSSRLSSESESESVSSPEFGLLESSISGVTLSYAAAIRTSSATEPASDGVTFRVWISSGGISTEGNLAEWDSAEKKLLDTFHTTSRTWVERTVDLSAYQGETVTLSLEVNPGPANDPTCDGCFVAGMVVGGTPPLVAASLPKAPPCSEATWQLADGFSATVRCGRLGIFDGTITLRHDESGRDVVFSGVELSVGAQRLSSPTTLFVEPPTCSLDPDTGGLTCRATILFDDAIHPVMVEVGEMAGMLLIGVPEGNPAPIGGLELGGASESLHRVYAGHGAVIEELAGPFRMNAGGHELATRHVGVDYANGISVLFGSEAPPEALYADPAKNLYTLSIPGVTRLALVPSAKSAFDAAISYRQRSPWREPAAPGTARKAGRLVFDIWGGTFEANRRAVEAALAYGVTDSLFVKHAWQRWGYDVKLPDIWGATESDAVWNLLGSLTELRALCDACRTHHVPFALHDNYIDFYPDADDFSYRYINFEANRTPRKGWINYGMEVQAYQWRSDLFGPFLDRNMKEAKRFLPAMDAYFVDVFTSAPPVSFWTEEGEFRPHRVSQQSWKEAFDSLSQHLTQQVEGRTEPGITISEAGADFLIGSLSGADCQWLGFSQNPRAWTRQISCNTWERTPWFSAVNQTNFSRHGVGYESRYLATRNRDIHGMMSDDYLSMELLGGVDLMVDDGSIFPGSVRKHDLLQGVIRSRTGEEIVSVEFVPDVSGHENIQRQRVLWSDGTTVWVNRGESDWTLSDGTLLPQFGYHAENSDGLVSTIRRNPANPTEVIEYSAHGNRFYLNGRGYPTGEIWGVTPSLGDVEILDGGRCRLALRWQCNEPLPVDAEVFVHVYEPYQGYGHNPIGWVAGGITPDQPTSQWGGRATPNAADSSVDSLADTTCVTTDGIVITVPNEIPSGLYHLMVGLWNPQTGKRFPLMAEDAGNFTYSVAALEFKRSGDGVTVACSPVPMLENRELFFRIKPNRTPATYRGVSTCGPVRVTEEDSAWNLLPLPLSPTFDATLQFDVTLDEPSLGRTVKKITWNGEDVPFTRDDANRVTFCVTAKDAIPYRIEW